MDEAEKRERREELGAQKRLRVEVEVEAAGAGRRRGEVRGVTTDHNALQLDRVE